MKFSGQISYSRTFDAVEKAATKLLQILQEKTTDMMQTAIGFDIEWKPTFRKGRFSFFSFFFNSWLWHTTYLIVFGLLQFLHLGYTVTILIRIW